LTGLGRKLAFIIISRRNKEEMALLLFLLLGLQIKYVAVTWLDVPLSIACAMNKTSIVYLEGKHCFVGILSVEARVYSSQIQQLSSG